MPSRTRVSCSGRKRPVFVLQFDFLDLTEGNHDFLRSMALVYLEMQVISGNAGNAIADELAAGGFDGQDHVLVSLATHHPKEPGELRFKKPSVEGKLAA